MLQNSNELQSSLYFTANYTAQQMNFKE